MTGGTDEAGPHQRRGWRARPASTGSALVLGSGRALLEDPALLATYRSADRPPLLLGNLGAAQVRLHDAPDARRAARRAARRRRPDAST